MSSDQIPEDIAGPVEWEKLDPRIRQVIQVARKYAEAHIRDYQQPNDRWGICQALIDLDGKKQWGIRD